MKDSAPPLSPAPTKDSGMKHPLLVVILDCSKSATSYFLRYVSSIAPPAAAAFTSPPTLSLPLPLPRVGLGDKDRAPVPQAVVKPQVLTHLIEGFVIQEGAEPFPVSGLCYSHTHILHEVKSSISQTTNGSFQLVLCFMWQVAGLLKDRDFALVGRSENGPARKWLKYW